MKPLPHNDIVERLRLAPHADFYKPSKWFELMRDAADEIERLRAQLTEAAAFLDEVANQLETEASPVGNQVAADSCRHMANKLRK